MSSNNTQPSLNTQTSSSPDLMFLFQSILLVSLERLSFQKGRRQLWECCRQRGWPESMGLPGHAGCWPTNQLKMDYLSDEVIKITDQTNYSWKLLPRTNWLRHLRSKLRTAFDLVWRAHGIHRAFLTGSRFAPGSPSWKIPSEGYSIRHKALLLLLWCPQHLSFQCTRASWYLILLLPLHPLIPTTSQAQRDPIPTRTEEFPGHSDVPALTAATLCNTEHSLKLRAHISVSNAIYAY